MDRSVLNGEPAPHMLTTNCNNTKSPSEELLEAIGRTNGHFGRPEGDVDGTGNRANCFNSGQASCSPRLESPNMRSLESSADNHHRQSRSVTPSDTPLSLITSPATVSPTRPYTSSSSRVEANPIMSLHTNKLGLENLHIPCTTQLLSRGDTTPALSAYGGCRLERSTHTGSPSGIPADSGHECRLIDYRGAKVAAFRVQNEYLLCLPQAFELFLKHLVGGLHTVYTKLKRMNINPIVCNVEQVRILRGLGAIQPGVNRCKLLSCNDFDALYKDCITASCRPGRPPKRVPMTGPMSSSASLLKKGRVDGEYHGYKNIQRNGDPLDKVSFLQNGYNQMMAQAAAAAAAAATGTPSHINPLPFMALNHQVSHHSMIPASSCLSLTAPSHAPTDRSDGAGIGERSGQISDSCVTNRNREDPPMNSDLRDRLYGQETYKQSSTIKRNEKTVNGHGPVLNLSQHSSRIVGHNGTNVGGCEDNSGSDAVYNDHMDEEDSEDDGDENDQDFSDTPDVSSTANTDHLSAQNPLFFPGVSSGTGAIVGHTVSSIETLLRNIQGLLKVAADNARQQERQINTEKAELKMEVMRERELRENLEKQILEEQKTKVLYQKRLRRERRSRRRVQEQLEAEVKRRSNYEGNFHSSSKEALQLLNDSLPQDLERDQLGRLEEDSKCQDLPVSLVASTTTPDSSPTIS
ncbi:dachshund homolog 1-like isoform X2 [Limulus polyphemus]|uniref:Dachshund homolog 1-like isoform X2 n=1 Tax=Limulus polyphemus TaxID=6850 RepID=A0ABM1T980_LIMPO|nr:dachshund homolog 1-like isoform X2 [Limulus polyphemus]